MWRWLNELPLGMRLYFWFWTLTVPLGVVLLFAGALVAGFLVYLLFRYRCGNGVLAPEQGWN